MIRSHISLGRSWADEDAQNRQLLANVSELASKCKAENGQDEGIKSEPYPRHQHPADHRMTQMDKLLPWTITA